MFLSVKERLLISALYPKASNIAEQLLIKDISAKVSFTKEESEKLKIRAEERGNLRWEPDVVEDKDIDFTANELNFLKEQVAKADSEKKVTQDTVDLYLKIKNS